MVRIVVAGSDSHDRSAEVVARALRDAGHEVVYTGPHQTPAQIVATAIQEDADLIGLPGGDPGLLRTITALLEERDAGDIAARTFAPEATTGEITGWVQHLAEEQNS